jgi:hypothetical protein
MLVLDSGGLTHLATRSSASLAMIRSLRREGLWPPVVPTMVVVESLPARLGPDAVVNRFLHTCLVEESVPLSLARRAAEIRRQARRGSAVDAVVIALAEPDGVVLTGDLGDLTNLAAQATQVTVVGI